MDFIYILVLRIMFVYLGQQTKTNNHFFLAPQLYVGRSEIQTMIYKILNKLSFYLHKSFISRTLCCFRATFVEIPLQIHPLFMQNKPNLRNAKMNLNHYTEMRYKENCLCQGQKNEPKRTQFQTPQFMPEVLIND